MTPPILTLDKITKKFGTSIAVDAIAFDIYHTGITAILGPSGCGKSTLLSLIAGLQTPDSGTMLWAGKDLLPVPTHERNFGLMFQDYALFPHMDVSENIAFGLRYTDLPADKAHDRVTELLDLVGLAGFGGRSIDSLSGGEQQRVALARSLAPRPTLLMLDEPLGALDRSLRGRLLTELRNILKSFKLPTIYVTHDQAEAFEIADRVILMRAGRVEQIGSPQEIYRNPRSVFAARFLGLENVIDGQIDAGETGSTLNTSFGSIPWEKPVPVGPVKILLRPETDLKHNEETGFTIMGVLKEIHFGGAYSRLTFETAAGTLTFQASDASQFPVIGAEIRLFIPADSVQILRDTP